MIKTFSLKKEIKPEMEKWNPLTNGFSSTTLHSLEVRMVSEKGMLALGEQRHMSPSQYVAFLAAVRIRCHRCVTEKRRVDTIWETKGDHQVRTRGCPSGPRHPYIIKSWHILPRRSPCPLLLCAYRATQKFYAHACAVNFCDGEFRSGR